MSTPPPLIEKPLSVVVLPLASISLEPRRSGNVVAFMASLVVHVAIFLVLACVAYRAGGPSGDLWFTASQGSSSTGALETLAAFELLPAHDPEAEITAPSSELTLDIALAALSANGDKGKTAASLTSVSVGDVIASLKDGGRERGASFFGSYAQGDHFVFVLDSSRSMKGDRWTYACNQLIDSLNALTPGQEFFIICFDEETSFMLNLPRAKAKYHEADEETVNRVRRWLRARANQLGRATMPADALRIGLEFNPDAIFLLSDGELQDNTIRVLRSINGFSAEPRQIPIHTIHLFSPQGRTSLELIAMENNGTFTHIDGK